MWQYLQSVGGTQAFLGIVVSAFSLGQLIGSPYWGYWSNVVSYRVCFVIRRILHQSSLFLICIRSHCILVVPFLLHQLPQDDGEHHVHLRGCRAWPPGTFIQRVMCLFSRLKLNSPLQNYFMAEGRLLVGLGAGNMALCNSYVSQATTLKERTAAVANLAATGVRADFNDSVCSSIMPDALNFRVLGSFSGRCWALLLAGSSRGTLGLSQ